MIGAKQFTRQIQHHFNEVPDQPDRKGGWAITLRLPEGDKTLPAEQGVALAAKAGQDYLDRYHIGKTL